MNKRLLMIETDKQKLIPCDSWHERKCVIYSHKSIKLGQLCVWTEGEMYKRINCLIDEQKQSEWKKKKIINHLSIQFHSNVRK